MHYIINSMNIRTTPPSSLHIHTPINNPLSSLAFLHQQQIIKILGAALTSSLTNYALSLPPPPPPTRFQPLIRPLQQHSVIQILSESEEVPAGKSGTCLPVSKQTHSLKKTPPVTKASPFLPKAVELSPTSEEVLKESPPHSPHPSKTKHIKKTKSARKEPDFHVEIPELDPIETVCLPVMGLPRGAMGKLRETLMRRRVSQWVQPAKKQKKEIRLLKP